MRVLMVIPGSADGSSMVFARRQAESLIAEGLDIECFYLRSRTAPVELVREFQRLRARIAAFQPAVVHAQFGTVTAAISALAAGELPLVITYRGGDLNPSPAAGLRSFLGRFLSQLAALRAARIVCVSKKLLELLWWRRNRAVIVPTGVDTELFRPEPRDAARARLGWPLDRPVILFNAGHDPRVKRLDLAERAAGCARDGLSGLHLEVLRGDTDPDTVPVLMNASDCLVITSDSEGSPAVLQEALACGLAIVSVNVGDAVERLQGVHNTRLVARDPSAIGRALTELIAAPLRTDGPGRVRALSLRETARQLHRLYVEIAGGAVTGAPTMKELVERS